MRQPSWSQPWPAECHQYRTTEQVGYPSRVVQLGTWEFHTVCAVRTACWPTFASASFPEKVSSCVLVCGTARPTEHTCQGRCQFRLCRHHRAPRCYSGSTWQKAVSQRTGLHARAWGWKLGRVRCPGTKATPSGYFLIWRVLACRNQEVASNGEIRWCVQPARHSRLWVPVPTVCTGAPTAVMMPCPVRPRLRLITGRWR